MFIILSIKKKKIITEVLERKHPGQQSSIKGEQEIILVSTLHAT